MAFGKCSSRFMVASFVLLMAAMRCAQAQETPVLRDIRDPNPYATRVVDPEVEAYFKQKAINDQKWHNRARRGVGEMWHKVKNAPRLLKKRSENIDVAHGKAQQREADPANTSDGPCLSSHKRMTEIRDGDALTYCDVLVSEGDSPATAQITAFGDVAVRPADSQQDRYTAINGKGWRNWGLTVKEKAERYVKYLRTGDEPERTLPIEPSEESVLLEVTARGRWILREGNRVLQRGGNSWWRALWTKAEPHALRLVNDELILIRLSDGAIIARIPKPARFDDTITEDTLSTHRTENYNNTTEPIDLDLHY